MPENTAEFALCHRQNLLKVLRRDLESKEVAFGADELASIRAELDALSEASTAEAREEHVTEARRVGAGEVCPRFGGGLVRRSGRYTRRVHGLRQLPEVQVHKGSMSRCVRLRGRRRMTFLIRP